MSEIQAKQFTDYKIKDIGLANFGRAEIRLAEVEMPGLLALREKYVGKRPLQGARISGSIHMTIQTAVLIENLVKILIWCGRGMRRLVRDHPRHALTPCQI